jgi:hypothetical protein
LGVRVEVLSIRLCRRFARILEGLCCPQEVILVQQQRHVVDLRESEDLPRSLTKSSVVSLRSMLSCELAMSPVPSRLVVMRSRCIENPVTEAI